MSKRYWCAAIAFGLTLLAPPALAKETQQPATQGQPSTSSDQGEAPATGDNNPAPEPGYAERFLTAIERIEPAIRELIAEESKTAAQEQRERDNADLRAQESMAVWAFWMFVTSAASVVLTFAGLLLIWRTLLYTRDAAVHAGAAVEEAKKATKAAQDAVDVTRDLGQKQVRAYIGVSSCKVMRKAAGDKVAVAFKIRNSGQSPARFLNVTYITNLNFRVRDSTRASGVRERGCVLTLVPDVQIVRSYIEFIGANDDAEIVRELTASDAGFGGDISDVLISRVSVAININFHDIFAEGPIVEERVMKGQIDGPLRVGSHIEAFPAQDVYDRENTYPAYHPPKQAKPER